MTSVTVLAAMTPRTGHPAQQACASTSQHASASHHFPFPALTAAAASPASTVYPMPIMYRCKCDDCGKMFDVSHYWSRRRAFLAAEHERGYDPQRLAAMLSQVTLTEPDLDDVADEEWPVSPVSQPGRRQWPVPVVVAAAVGGLSTVGLVILLVLLATGVIV